jgi:hypothetical protein
LIIFYLGVFCIIWNIGWFFEKLVLTDIFKYVVLQHKFVPVLQFSKLKIMEFFMISELIKYFSKQSPISVMNRALLENIFTPERLNAIFDKHRHNQRNRKWFFSSIVYFMILVVCRIHPSIRSTYQSHAKEAGASLSSFYKKLNGLDLSVSEAFVRETASRIRDITTNFSCPRREIISGYRNRIVDGNKIAATDRRPKVLREQSGSPLPGFGLVVYEPECNLITETILCEDGHAQERSLFSRLLELVQPNDLWVADRNFCCWNYLSGIAQKSGYFLIRQHASTRWKPTSELVHIGNIETGEVFEQKGYLESPMTGERLLIRRIEVHLQAATRDGDMRLGLFSNLPETVSALDLALAYRKRWWIESAFQELEKLLEGEIQTLAYPPAALFALSMAFVAYNILQCIIMSIETAHPKQPQKISIYYIAHEIDSCYRGLDLLTKENEWNWARKMTPNEIAQFLLENAASIDYKNFAKRPPTKKTTKRKNIKKTNHVSTKKLINKP